MLIYSVVLLICFAVAHHMSTKYVTFFAVVNLDQSKYPAVYLVELDN